MTGPPEDVVRLAAATLMAGRRLDTGTLAAELGISRATLFRRAGNRDAILGEAIRSLAHRTLRAIEREYDAGPTPPDRLRSLAVSERFRYALSTAVPVRRLLDEEPATAIRVFTDPTGRVQPAVVEDYTALFQRDVDERGLTPRVPVPLLAMAVVRLGESFLYSDVLAARAPDLAAATTVLDALVTSIFGLDGR